MPSYLWLESIDTDMQKVEVFTNIEKLEVKEAWKATKLKGAKDSSEVIRAKWEIGVPYRVPCYEHREGKWKRFDYKQVVDPSKRLERIRCVTYNVWFDDFKQEERYSVIMAMLE